MSQDFEQDVWNTFGKALTIASGYFSLQAIQQGYAWGWFGMILFLVCCYIDSRTFEKNGVRTNRRNQNE